MKNKNTPKNTESDENLKSALLKILIDLDVELPENISLDTTNNIEEDENIELNNIKNKE